MINHYIAARQELEGPGSPFAVTTVEVRGQQLKTFAAAPPNMRVVWEMTAAHGDKKYLVYEDESYTYAEIHAQVRKLAQYLVDQGVKRGDRVAISTRNYPEWVVTYWACVSIGVACVGMNAWWTPVEMDYALGDSEPKVLIVDDERLDRYNQVPTKRDIHVISVRSDRPLPPGGIRWADVMAKPDPGVLPPANIDPDDDATIFYTSGTTGFPKGAQLHHRGSVVNVLNIAAMTTAASSGIAKAVAAGDLAAAPPAPPALPPVFMAPTPLFHVTACNCILHPATLVGGTVVLMYKWDPGRALELIEREKITNFSGVPTMGRELLMHPDWKTRDTSSLAAISGGGAAVQPDLVEKIDKELETGTPTTGYGMTETHGIITANTSLWYTTKPSSCGPAVPTLEVKLVDEEGHDLPRDPNIAGVLCVKGSIVIKGYLNRPDATAESIKDGWLNTGDIARIDQDGFIYIVDRAKDMVIRGGENVYCAEVEAAVFEHDSVADCAVFGVPHPTLMEEVALVVIPKDGHGAQSTDSLVAHLKSRLSAF
ncbi:MAG: class I adenylate-forming enzyme family protein, partial [Actinomycetota bacterium]